MKKLVLYFLKFLSWIAYHLPRPVQMFLGDLVGYLWFDILRLRRKVIDSNLQIAFPEWDESERIRVGRESCKGMGRALVEYFVLPHINGKNLDKYFVCDDWGPFERANEEGKGVLLLSLHLGSYDLLSAYLAIKGMDLYLISKELSAKNLNDLWFGLRKSKGVKFISDRKAKFDIIKALKKKAAVAFVIDQFTGPPIGIETEFFGKKTGSAKGLALFHAWTKSPVVPVYNYRRPDNKIQIVFGEAIELESFEDRDQTVAFMTQKYNTELEEIIKKHPEQWLWVHKRWKKFKY